MTIPFQFDESQFEHLEDMQETLAKLLLYRRDFQEEVLKIREKYNLNNFPKLKIKEDGDYSELFTNDIDEAFEDDIESLIELVGYSLDDWLGFVYLFVRYNFITVPPESQEFSKESLKDIEEGYKKDKPLESVDRIIYDSPSVTVQTEQGEVLCFYRKIPNKKEEKTIKTVIKSALRVMGKKFQRDFMNLDYYYKIAQLDREGKDYLNIEGELSQSKKDELAKKVGEADATKIVYGEDCEESKTRASSIRKELQRAKKLGF